MAARTKLSGFDSVTSFTDSRLFLSYNPMKSSCTNGALTHRVSSTGAPQPDVALNKAATMKIRHYRQIYVDRTDPIVFLPITVDTSGRVYEDFPRLLFLHKYREVSILAGELPEASEQFRFLRDSRFANHKDSEGLILVKPL